MKPADPRQGRLQEALATLRPTAPPGDLSARVRERLQHPEPPPPPTLLQRLGFEIETRPVVVGLSGAAVCLMLIAVILASKNVKPPPESVATGVPPELASEPNARRIGQARPPITPAAGQGQLQPGTMPILVAPDAADRVPMHNRTPQ